MTKGCEIALCQQTPATRVACCNKRLCEQHGSSVLNHDCPRAKEIDAIASDPKKLREWKKAQEGEESMTQALVDGLNALPDIELAWQSRKRGGVRANDAARAVGDVTAIARDPRGLHVEVELKGSHKDGCVCDSCVVQRDRAERVGAYGLYVGPVRTVQQGIDGVKMGLAMARGRERKAG